MEFSPEYMEYRFREAESSYLVWLKSLNRYLQLEEPAFNVFKQFKKNQLRQEMIRAFSQKYQLPSGEAERFIGEIEEQFHILYRDYQKPKDPSIPFDTCPQPSATPVEKWISVADKCIRFSFGERTIEEFIFPLFTHLEIPPASKEYDLHLEIFIYKRYLYLLIDQKRASKWLTPQAPRLKGALLLEVINVIHQSSEKSWLGVIHASSVCWGEGAVLFPAQAGGGKSTLAALLMSHGCSLIADDFTPLSRENQNIYPVPGAISIKQGSMPLLKSYFPDLANAPQTRNLSKGVDVSFLAPSNPKPIQGKGYPVSAIVFVEYNGETECELERVNNLDVINDFLRESWLAQDSHAAEQFMKWYLDTPCYSLRYGNHQKAIESIQKLF